MIEIRCVYTYIYEVHEVPVGTVHHVVQVLAVRHSNLAPRIWRDYRIVVVVEEHFSSGGPGEHGPGRNALDLHHERHVVLLVLSGEQWVPNIQLIENAAETPHVNSTAVWNT